MALIQHPDQSEQNQGSEGQEAPIPETRPPEATPDDKKGFLRSKTAKVIAGATALATFGGGAFIAGSRTNANESEEGKTPAAAAAPATTEAPTTTTQKPAAETEKPKTVDLEPVLLDGESAEEIMDQFTHNIECAYNNTSYDAQYKCLSYLLGDDIEGDGELTRRQLGLLSEVNSYRENNPDYEYTFDFDIDPDKVVSGPYRISIGGSYTDPAGTKDVSMIFVRADTPDSDLTDSGTNSPTWKWVGEESL